MPREAINNKAVRPNYLKALLANPICFREKPLREYSGEWIGGTPLLIA